MFLLTDQPGEGAEFRFTPGWLVGTLALWAAIAVSIAALTSLT